MLKKFMERIMGIDDQNLSNWNMMSGKEDLNILLETSKEKPQILYKHSSRCSISYLAKENLEEHMEDLLNHADIHLIDVTEQRDLSNNIAQKLDIRHESPQAIILKNGGVAWSGSHWDVNVKNILSVLT